MAQASRLTTQPILNSQSFAGETSAEHENFSDIDLERSQPNNTRQPCALPGSPPKIVSRENTPAKTGNARHFISQDVVDAGKDLALTTPQAPAYVMTMAQRRVANQRFSSLMEAIQEGEVAEVGKLLELGVEINRPDSNGLTALHRAATSGHLRIVALLVEHGALIPAATPLGYTPLALAANGGHLAVVEYLIHVQHSRTPQNESRAVSPAKPAARATAAPDKAAAVSSDGLDIFEAMATAYASRTNKENMGELAIAVKKGSLEGVVRMIASIAKSLAWKGLVSRVGTLEEFREALNAHLADACRAGRVDIVQALLCAGVPVDTPDRLGVTPLMQAVIQNQTPMVAALLKAGAVLDHKDNRGHTALSLAIDGGQLAVLTALMDARADIWNATVWNEPLIYYAAANRKTEIVRALLAQRADLLDADGSKVLARSARAGCKAAVETLLSAGADPNHRAADGHTAFTLAAANGHKKVLAMLLGAQAGVEWQRGLQTQCDKQGRTALMLAALNDQVEAAKLLLDHDADLRQRDFAGRTALLWAAVGASAAMLDLLAHRGAKLNCADDHGDTIFTLAASHNNLSGMTSLCKASISRHQLGIDTPNRDGDTALIKAARGGYLEMVRLLNHSGANMLATNNEGRTAIHEATAHGYMEVVAYIQREVAAMPKVYPYANGALSLLGKLPLVSTLLPERVPVRTRELDMDGNSLIMVAAANGRETMLRELFEIRFDAGDIDEQAADLLGGVDANALVTASSVSASSSPSKFNIEQTNREGLTALCQAARNGQYAVMKYLIDQGARASGTFQTDVVDKKAVVTPLWLAARLVQCPAGNGTEGSVYKKSYTPEMLVQLLLEHGAQSDIDTSCGQWGQTPLLAAAVAGRAEVVQLLLQHGASIGVRDIQGIGPLMYAAWHGRREVVELLLNHGAAANVTHGEISALILAAENDHIDIVQLLVKRGARLDHADSLGTTALIGATRRGKTNAVRSLIALGANLHHVDNRGNSALSYASRDRHDEIISLLGKGAPPPRDH